MTIPLSVRRQIERVEKGCAQLRSKLHVEIVSGSISDIDLELHTLFRELSDCCDQIANAAWIALNPGLGDRKPNVYWPISRDEEGFLKLLDRSQLTGLGAKFPKTLSMFRESQSWANPEAHIPKIKQLASARHEGTPEMTVGMESALSIGHGEVVHIESMRTGARGEIVELRGTEISGGIKRPITVNQHNYPTIRTKTQQSDLFNLLSNACSDLKSRASSIFEELSN